MKVAVVTPYHGESISTLRRCHYSVMDQSAPARHFLVGDGDRRDEVLQLDAEHISLATRHSDGGDTPRAIGAISAISQGFDAVAFLDADNWYHRQHIERCVDTCERQGVDVAFASRQIVLSSGLECDYDDRDADEGRHVDTSCFFITKRASFLLPLWGMIDRSLWQACDRIMLAAVKTRGVLHAWTNYRTVFYTSKWGLHYHAMGLPAPPDEHQIDWAAVSRAYEQADIVSRFGFDPQADLGSGNDHHPVDGSYSHGRLSIISRRDSEDSLARGPSRKPRSAQKM